MPLSKYYSGHGESVMREMVKKHGKDAKRIFYATANKKGLGPSEHVVKKGAKSA